MFWCKDVYKRQVVNSCFDSNEEKFETKFDKLSSDVNEQNAKCDNSFNELNKCLDINDQKFDELKSDINKMKLQNFNIDKRINNIDKRLSNICLLYTSRCV